MEGATLTFRFVEEGGNSGKGPSVTPQSSTSSPKSSDTTQQAITNAGGVSNFVNQNNPAPTPSSNTFQVPTSQPLAVPPSPTTTASTDPLLSTVTSILQADPNTTIEELAKALGINRGQASNLYNQAVGTPTPPLVTPPSAQPIPTPSSSPPPLPPLPTSPQSQNTPPKPLPDIPKPPPLGLEQLLHQAKFNPPPIPGTPSSSTINGVQNTIQAITGLAQLGGPVAGAIGRVSAATTAIPGVAGALGTALPALATLAPVIAAAGTVAAVPPAVLYSIDRIYDTARGQLQGLDPSVATAEAEANVRQILANFRTSRILGDEVAQGVEIQSRRSTALQGIRDRLIEAPLEKLNNSAAGLNVILETINETFNNNPELVKILSGGAYNIFKASTGAFGTILQGLELIGQSKTQENLATNNPLTYWMNKPLPKLPAPFTETGEVIPHEMDSKNFLPGLGIK